jgi:hypothetical protein
VTRSQPASLSARAFCQKIPDLGSPLGSVRETVPHVDVAECRIQHLGLDTSTKGFDETVREPRRPIAMEADGPRSMPGLWNSRTNGNFSSGLNATILAAILGIEEAVLLKRPNTSFAARVELQASFCSPEVWQWAHVCQPVLRRLKVLQLIADKTQSLLKPAKESQSS